MERAVLVTGPDGPLVQAVTRRLEAARISVGRAGPGDHIPDAMRGVQAVVILDGIGAAGTPVEPKRYAEALRAVAAGLLDADVRRVVGVAYCPRGRSDRERYHDAAAGAEKDLAGALADDFVAVRSALVVASPRQPGPSDPWLFKRTGQPALPVPAKGRAQTHPILVEDVAAVVHAAVTTATPPGGPLVVGGPDLLSVEDLLEQLNGSDVRLWRLPRFLQAGTHLPSKEAEVETGAEHAGKLGVGCESVSSVWDARAVAARAQGARDANRQAANKYARTRLAVAASVWFTVLGFFGAIVGIHDLFEVDDFQIAIYSLVVTLTSALLVGAAIGLWVVRWKRRFALATVAAAVATVVGLLLFGAQVNSGDPLPGRWVVPAVIVLPGVAFVFMLRQRAGSILHGLNPLKGFGAVLTTVGFGTLFSAFGFWYANFYLPGTATPTISLNATLTKVGLRDDSTVLDATITAKNTADIPVNVLGSLFQVTGSDIRRPTPEDKFSLRRKLLNEQVVRHQVRAVAPTLVDAGEVVPTGFFMEKNEEIVRRYRVYVPSTVDLASLRIYLIVSRRKLVLGTGRIEYPNEPGEALVTRFELNHDSWLRRLIRERQILHVEQSLSSLGDRTLDRCRQQLYPALHVYVDRPGRKQGSKPGCDPYNSELAQYYGVAGTSTVAQVDLNDTKP